MAPSQQIPHKWRNRLIVFGGLAIVGCCSVLVYGVNQGGKITNATNTALAGTQLVQRSWTATASLTPVPTGTPTIAPTPTVSPTPTETPTPLPTFPPKTQTALAESAASTALAAAKTAVVAASLTASAASPTPSQTPLPSVTPDPSALGLSLVEFARKYNAMTDLQKKNYLPSVEGKSVAWTSRVIDVLSNGKVVLNLSDGLLDSVELEDLPADAAVSVNKDTTIKFTGVINRAIDLLGLHIYINQAQLVK